MTEQDEHMTDDMRLAISALGLMRQGAGEPPSAAAASSSNDPPSTSAAARMPSAVHPYRSDSTHSLSTAESDSTWTTTTSTTTTTHGHGRRGGPGGARGHGSRSESEFGTGTTSPVTTGTSGPPSEGGDELDRRGPEGSGGGSDIVMDSTAGPARVDGAAAAAEHDAKFIERVSQLPLVSGGIEWYERSKANSRVVKYGAGLVESSFSAVSRPISNNLQLGPLDEFACRQLDRIGAAGGSSAPSSSPPKHQATLSGKQQSDCFDVDRTETPEQDQSMGDPSQARTSPTNDQVALHSSSQRSRWQTVLVEAGGLGAAVSEESLKSLRYCLQWLLYATAHLDHQISTLRDFILSLRAHNRASPSSASTSSATHSTALVAASASAHLSQIKHDVVETIRKVVEVVSKYAGAALPEQAKRYVKQSIMGLPVKWASAIEGRAAPRNGFARSRVGGEAMDRDGSDLGTPRIERMRDGRHDLEDGGVDRDGKSREDEVRDREEEEARAALGPTEEAADRVLTFAVESLDMLRSVTNIFGESVEKAEAWIERLRIIGLQRQHQRQRREEEGSSSDEVRPPLSLSMAPSTSNSPSISSSTAFEANGGGAAAGIKRRRGDGRRRSESGGGDGSGAAGGGGGGGEVGARDGADATEGLTTDAEEEQAAQRRKRGARTREPSVDQ
ncbi:hypothetical protein JCM10212_006947 [Sporobolomyces blumeae]